MALVAEISHVGAMAVRRGTSTAWRFFALNATSPLYCHGYRHSITVGGSYAIRITRVGREKERIRDMRAAGPKLVE